QDNARLSAGIADGTATYDQLRSVNTGFTGWFFSGDSPISCGNCAGSAQGTLQLWVDFANHTLGGSGTFAQSQSGQNVSFVHLHNIYSVGDTVQRNIAAVDYFPLSGDAKYSPSFSGAVTCTAGCAGGESFAGTTIEIRNAGGVIAAQAVGNIQFASSTRSISATVTSPREGATAAP
ncbi:MAG: hypothetical protein HY925_03475, partial [Elusimicrobia bacterium]|nr:hypothetical protein [Elusimicrobiota bacterium]